MTLGRIKARGVMGLCVGKVMEHKQQFVVGILDGGQKQV
jgi:hypothetical protein